MTQKMYSYIDSEIGRIYAVMEDNALLSIYIGEEDFKQASEKYEITYAPDHLLLITTMEQLRQYFSGERREFDLPFVQKGTDFQKAVWEQLLAIPFGQTRSYQEIAEAIDNPKAVRAIGQANKANRLPIIIPCHRVIGKNQSLTGYAGTRTDIKEKLLSLEGAYFRA